VTDDGVLDELRGLQDAVGGVVGCVVATSDGLLVASTLADDEPAQFAALVSTVVSLGRHAVEMTGRGTLREATIRGAEGHVVVHAIGETAVLAVVGRADLNVALLQLHARPAVQRLVGLAPRFARFLTPAG
jgi:predicted regulator of Ras-like GTPase activity (Roadblock/LC7/MglB family)